MHKTILRYRAVFLVSAVCFAIAAVMVVLRPGERPVRLWELRRDTTGPFALWYTRPRRMGDREYNFNIFSGTDNKSTYQLYSRMVHSGQWKPVSQEIVEEGTFVGLGIREKEAVAVLLPAKTTAEYSRLYGMSNPTTPRAGQTEFFEGVFRSSEGGSPGDEERKMVPRVILRKQPPPTVLHFPLSDEEKLAPLKRSAIDVDGYALDDLPSALTPYGLFWVRPEAATVTTVRSKKRPNLFHTERTATDTLMFTPFGGKPVVVKRNCLILQLAYVDNVVRFSEAGYYPQGVSGRFQISADNGSPPVRLLRPLAVTRKRSVRSTTYTREVVTGGQSTLPVGDRCYWLERNADVVDSSPFSRYRQSDSVAGVPGPRRDAWGKLSETSEPALLMSARPDGTDLRVVGELRDETGNIDTPSLLADSGRLYVLYYRLQTSETTGRRSKTQLISYIARLHTDQPGDVVGTPMVLDTRVESSLDWRTIEVDSVPISGDDFYYTISEKRKDWSDVFSERDTTYAVRTGWRVRLPD